MRKGERTRQHVIEKSALLLNRRGYLSTTLSEITEETGLQKGGLYNHFRDKEELSLASFSYNCDALNAYLLREVEAAPANAVDRLLAYMKAFFKVDYPGGCPIANLTIEADSVSDPLLGQARVAMERMLSFAEELISSGIRNQEIRQEVDPRESAVLMFSMIEGAILMRKLYPGSTDNVLDRLARFIHTELKV